MRGKPATYRVGDIAYETADRQGSAAEALPVFGVQRGVGLTSESRYSSKDLSRYKRLMPGDFAYNPMRLNIGSIGMCRREHGHVLVSPDYVTFRLNDAVVPEYFHYITQTDRWKEWTAREGTGSVRSRIYFSHLARMEVRLPDIRYQRSGANVLGSLDRRIELLERTNETLEEIGSTIFKSWFIDFDPVKAKIEGQQPDGVDSAIATLFPSNLQPSVIGPIPQGWRAGTVGDLLGLQRGFDLPASERTDGPYTVFAAGGPHGRHCEAMAKAPGVITGRSGVIGKVYFSHDDYWPLNTALWVKEFKVASAEYAYHLLRSMSLERLNAGSAVPTLNRNHVHEQVAVVPQAELVNAFTRVAAPLIKKAHENQQHISRLIGLRDELLPWITSGQVALPECEEEVERAVS